jgi:hypothetical protein
VKVKKSRGRPHLLLTSDGSRLLLLNSEGHGAALKMERSWMMRVTQVETITVCTYKYP